MNVFAHPEFLSRFLVCLIVVFAIVRLLAFFFNRRLKIPYPPRYELLINVLTTGFLTGFGLITDWGMAAKGGVVLIGGSFFGVWQDWRSSQKKQARTRASDRADK